MKRHVSAINKTTRDVMTNHVLLDNVTHKDLKVDRVFGQDQGDGVNVARVFPVELGRLQNEYPLFFYKNADTGHFETIALLGFANGENLYLGDSGWDASCIPLSIERQPPPAEKMPLYYLMP